MRIRWTVGLLCIIASGYGPPRAVAQFLYWADAQFGSPSIGRSDLNGGNVMTVALATQSMPQSLALDQVNNRVYSGDLSWTNAAIRRTIPDLSSTTVVSSGGSVIRGVAVDQTGTRLYWTTSNLSTGASVRTSLVDGSNEQVLYSFTPASGANLRGIVADGSTIYWADFGTGRIQRGDLGGASPIDVVTGLGGPVGVALGGNGYLYWTEANGNAIKRCALSSPTVQPVLAGLATPNYLTIDPVSATMFWTEIGTPRIRKADLTGANVQTLGITVVHPTGIIATSSPLPVQLASFTGVLLESGDVRLSWRTVSQLNNYGFYVQRRQGGDSSYSELEGGFVPGHGTTGEPHEYSFLDSAPGAGLWYYRLKQVDLDGSPHYSEPIRIDVLTGVTSVAPLEFALHQNYPNPFNPATTISFSLRSLGRTSLRIFDMLGREVATLLDENLLPGKYQATFDATGLASGIYYYRLQSGAESVVRSLVVLK